MIVFPCHLGKISFVDNSAVFVPQFKSAEFVNHNFCVFAINTMKHREQMRHKFFDVVVALKCTVFLLLHKFLYERHPLINHLVFALVKIKITVIYEIGLVFI